MKGKTHDLNQDLIFSAHTFNCVCHSIRSMFRVLGIYNFGCTIKLNLNLSYYVMQKKRKKKFNKFIIAIKGQEISKWNCGVFNFQKHKTKNNIFFYSTNFQMLGRNNGLFFICILGELKKPQFPYAFFWYLLKKERCNY